MSNILLFDLDLTDRLPRMSLRVAFVGGIGRSGSTLLCRMLGRVPGVVHVGEICYLWKHGVTRNRVCSCGAPFNDCAFWRSVGEQAFGSWTKVDAEHADRLRRRVERNRFLPRLAVGGRRGAFARDLREYGELMTTVLTAVRDVSGANLIVDNSKLPCTAYLRRRMTGVDLHLLHLVRSPQGVAYSRNKRFIREDTGKPMPRNSALHSAGTWLGYNALYEVMAMLRVPRTVIRYEDLVTTPGPVLTRVLDRLGVPHTDADLSFISDTGVDLASDHSFGGNPTRVRVGPMPLRLDDAWRTEMRATDRRVVGALTVPGRLRYGYSRSAPRPSSGPAQSS